MTGRSSALLAAAALMAAVLALAAHPLLPHPHARPTLHDRAAVSRGPRLVASIANTAATWALACPTTRALTNGVDCGRLHVTRRQTHCPTDTQCQVELVGTVRTRTVDVAVALTVTLTNAAGQWRAVEVTS